MPVVYWATHNQSQHNSMHPHDMQNWQPHTDYCEKSFIPFWQCGTLAVPPCGWSGCHLCFSDSKSVQLDMPQCRLSAPHSALQAAFTPPSSLRLTVARAVHRAWHVSVTQNASRPTARATIHPWRPVCISHAAAAAGCLQHQGHQGGSSHAHKAGSSSGSAAGGLRVGNGLIGCRSLAGCCGGVGGIASGHLSRKLAGSSSCGVGLRGCCRERWAAAWWQGAEQQRTHVNELNWLKKLWTVRMTWLCCWCALWKC